MAELSSVLYYRVSSEEELRCDTPLSPHLGSGAPRLHIISVVKFVWRSVNKPGQRSPHLPVTPLSHVKLLSPLTCPPLVCPLPTFPALLLDTGSYQDRSGRGPYSEVARYDGTYFIHQVYYDVFWSPGQKATSLVEHNGWKWAIVLCYILPTT